LLGRLFQSLGERATLIYLRPFQDPERIWSSILLATVQELGRPDKSGQRAATQLEAFAAGVLAHVAADFITGRGLDKQETIKRAIGHLRDHPLEVFARRNSSVALFDWLRARLENPSDLVQLAQLLADRELLLDEREKAWLKVLAGYALGDVSSLARDASLCWLRGEPLESDQAKALNLTAAENDGYGDATASEVNDLCRKRLHDLCMLASYYRPFVFCFDQTEFYGGDARLVHALGNSIEQLFIFPNNLTVITSNANNWLNDILPHMSAPDRDRVSSPIELEGINQRQAAQLISERLREVQAENSASVNFSATDWLSSVFSGQRSIGVRRLLQEAARRFNLTDDSQITAPKSMTEAFDMEINQVRAKPSLHQYSQDCLIWFAETMARGFDGVRVTRQKRKYFAIHWVWQDRSISFAFEAGHHNARWRAIATEAINLAAVSSPSASVVFRTPDLRAIPGVNWSAARQMIDDAEKQGLRILNLTIDEVCELHAAREFYSNALQGNIDFKPHEVLAFLRERFAAWFGRISNLCHGPVVLAKICPAGPAPSLSNGQLTRLTSAQIEVVVAYLRERRLVDVQEVLDKLGGGAFKEALLTEVENLPNLKAHAGAQTIVLQWRA
jgi:hypothetical protein